MEIMNAVIVVAVGIAIFIVMGFIKQAQSELLQADSI